MPEFDCKLVTEEGSVIETIIEADSKFEIYENAESRKELVLFVREHKKPLNLQVWIRQFRKAKPREIENFTTLLATMLDAGVPLLASLEALMEQAETDRLKEVIKSLINELNSGASLSQAMRRHPKVFSVMYTNMVESGEKAGVLDTILRRLSLFIGHELDILASIKSSVRYPIIIFCILILAFTLAILFVIPRFAALYQAQDIELPLPTRALIGINQAVTDYWMYTLFTVTVTIAGVVYFLRTPRGKKTVDFLKLKVPVFKIIFLKSAIARFAHMLETLSRSGIQIISALETIEKTVGNVVISEDIAKAKQKVSEGIALATSLSESKYFPPTTLTMLAVGEQSGALDEMLNKVAEQYDREVDHVITRLTAMIEPMMTVVMGAFVLFIALGIFLPMWKVYEVF